MSIPQRDDSPRVDIVPEDGPIEILEIKSYSAERHIACGYTPKAELEERWQVAAAMAAVPNVQRAYVAFYNPSLEQQMFVFEYARDDLADEIKVVKEVEALWLQWLDAGSPVCEAAVVHGFGCEENAIVMKLAEEQQYSPDDNKTVIL